MDRKVIKARDVMQDKHLELDGMATVKQALEAMRSIKSNAVIVKKRDEHDAYGIVLLSDIAKRVLALDRAPERVNIYEIMSKPVIPVEPDMDVRYVARMFDSFGLSSAPVVEKGRVIGIVSYDELVFDGLCELID
ncbi:CBS domain-containing protein [Pseudohalioglobus lutimaris]|uniref:CBS domain-containing protein n=1 Tax=Pseudohalioglobus lutimaris TaxID=1737061 RepID=A0A2N5WZN9_9GAMM|nr:CBS domain-containing protein [Pseudohalioglobus lutimaris]PLW67703.1 CBS domain-containing protein [Pseudohalioglobus lutimaris]